MTFDYKLHQIMWLEIARTPQFKKYDIIHNLYANGEINPDQRDTLLCSLNHCLACDYALEEIKNLKICPSFIKPPKMICCYCPFDIKNQSTEECLDGKYLQFIKLQKWYTDNELNNGNIFERKKILHELQVLARIIAHFPLKAGIKQEDGNT